MTNSDLIKKINDNLISGDQVKLAKLTGLTAPTINRFLKGQENSVSDETASKIIKKAALLIARRRKLQAKNVELIETATKNN